MNAPAVPPSDAQRVDPKRDPAALAGAISEAWRPYRWRAYAVGVAVGLFAGGVIAPIVTTLLVLALTFAGVAVPSVWPELAWTIAFALTVPAVAASAFARWQPRRLRMAAQSYIWLAMRAEEHWAKAFGAVAVPRDEAGVRAFLASSPQRPETSGERCGLLTGIHDLDRARAAAKEMPEATAADRFRRISAEWLIDFVSGRTPALEPLALVVDEIEPLAERQESAVGLAVNRARVALAQGRDWQEPMAAVREPLGPGVEQTYERLVWRPTFRNVLLTTGIGAIVFWIVRALYY